jgi:DNA repair protein RecO (recombination protein O)
MDGRRQRVYKTEAIILKRVKLGEADRIITFYTPRLGKVQGVAKGVRKTTSKLAGHLEPFTRSALVLAKGRNLDVITQAQALDNYLSIRADYERTARALYLLELIDRFTPDQLENIGLYRLLREGLEWLAAGEAGDASLRLFEMRLLTLTGYRLELRRCVLCQQPLAATAAHFSPAGGGVVCDDCRGGQTWLRPISLNAQKVLRFLEEADQPEAERLRLSEALRSELSGLLHYYIEFQLEGELRSLPFLRGREQPVLMGR